ncbi:MAG: SAM-dependent methyltransferase [Gemmatimonadetes bacterium]|nr:SAM-dependent methyltransferase [Gemmatimonadota bacterium]
MIDPLQAKWDSRHRVERIGGDRPSPYLVSIEPLLPSVGSAIDVGGGAGRNAIWLARKGLDTTVADISPVALARAARLAGEAGVEIATIRLDLESDPFPPGPWNLVVTINFLFRPLFAPLVERIAPGGLLVVSQPTVRNLERHPRPPREFLLEAGEIVDLCPSLDPIQHTEDWTVEGRHEAHFVGYRPGAED